MNHESVLSPTSVVQCNNWKRKCSDKTCTLSWFITFPLEKVFVFWTGAGPAYNERLWCNTFLGLGTKVGAIV